MRYVLSLVTITIIGFAAAAAPANGKPVQTRGHKAKFKPYGPPVKLDITARRCFEKGDNDYRDSLFYEEFKSMDACREALRRT